MPVPASMGVEVGVFMVSIPVTGSLVPSCSRPGTHVRPSHTLSIRPRIALFSAETDIAPAQCWTVKRQIRDKEDDYTCL